MSKYIECTATSVQKGIERFPDRHDKPEVKSWRCDLTALSRSHNFYFIACDDAVHVYQPSFPDQSIPGEPDLILHPPTSSSDLEPGIDYLNPHSITRLHVDYLGQDEIILIACDDGDVVGYRIEEIKRVLDKRAEIKGNDDEFSSCNDVRTFLHRNVGASAWGLAIHREARMIAISANTHQVTVIAYALAMRTGSSEDTESENCESGDCSEGEDSADFPSPRRQDHVITLSASHNIPAVSFDNSGNDTAGRWLSGSCIDSEAIIWDLHDPERHVRTFRVGFCVSVIMPNRSPNVHCGGCECFRPNNFPHAVWSTMFLDPSTAYETPVTDLVPESQHHAPCFQDISKCKKRFTFKKHGFPGPAMTVDPVNSISEDSSEMYMSDTASDMSDDEDFQPSSSDLGDAEQQYLDDGGLSNAADPAYSVADANQGSADEDANDGANAFSAAHLQALLSVPPVPPPESPPAEEPVVASNAINAFGVWFQPPGQETETIVWEDPDNSDTEDELFVSPTMQAHMAFGHALRSPRAYCQIATAREWKNPISRPTPLLIISKEDVYLVQRPLDTNGDYSDPIITIRLPLHSLDLSNSRWPAKTHSHDRQCYTTQIPELGIFIVASPNGRAGVFSLTKKAQGQTLPLYSFELEYVLPFANENPSLVCDVVGARLIGVAAGPVQGMLDQGSEAQGESDDAGAAVNRRWRLLMYFSDHTVLAFELAKKKAGGMVDVGELIV